MIRLVVLAAVLGCSSHSKLRPDAAQLDAAIDSAPACPVGLGDRFTCDADSTHRIRCVDGHLASIACANGCVAATAGDDAACACGASMALSRWNCGSDGDLHSCAGGVTLLSRSCEGHGCTVAPLGVSDACSAMANPLQTVLDELGARCGQLSPGTMCGLAVRDLATGQEAHYRGNAFYVSASSAKAVWVAAALYDTSVAAVMPYATPVFRDSDNLAAGAVIDLLASPERVNTFMWNDIGVPDSGYCAWGFGHPRNAANCPPVMSGDNFFTADDMLQFVTALWDRSLLGDPKAQAELGWMLLSPRSGYGGWLGTQLPAAAQQTMHHKAGWLPPDEVPGYTNSNEIGIVETPNGHAYGVAILMSGATDYNGTQLPLMEYASCIIYHAVAGDAAACTPP